MTKKNLSRRFFLCTSSMVAASSITSSAKSPISNVQSKIHRSNSKTYTTDVLVCGGGPSGMAAATMAARQGRNVILVERYGRLGGMAVHAVVNPLMGRVKSPFVDEVLKRLGGKTVQLEKHDLVYADLVHEAGGKILLHSWAADVEMKSNRVAGVTFVTKQGPVKINAAITVDATGDGDIAWLSGAEYEKGRPEDGLMQPMSVMFHIGGVDSDQVIYCGGERQAKKVRVPEGIWEDVVLQAQKAGELPPEIGVVRIYRSRRENQVGINATQINHVDGTNIEDLTKAELEGRRQAFQVLEFLRRHAPGFQNAYISIMPAVVGVRETRRFIGTEYLVRKDLIEGRKRDDAVVHDAQFVIDIHNPDGAGQAEGLAAHVKPYDIPFGCLVPRSVDGLLTAGRCISGSHDAHASYRVQCIAMATGAAAGAAAAEAIRTNFQPRELDVKRIQKILA